MNKFISKFLIGACAVVSMTACSDDFLETAPTDSTSTVTVFSTTENVKMAVNGLSYLMKSQHAVYGQGYCGENRIRSIYYEYPSQEFRYNVFAPGWAPIINGLYYSQKSSVYCSYPWAYYYEIISNANAIVNNVDDASGEESEKQFYKAQALVFRSYCYVKLLELYTPRWQDTNDGTAKGVVMRVDESTGPQALSTVAECYAQIYQDLDDAIANFTASGVDRGATEFWLTNINVAYAVYARAALNKQDYAKALSMAQKARQGYPLMTNDEYAAGFCAQTSEWLFGSYDDATENNWYWTFGTQFGCNGYYAANTQYGAGEISKELTDRIPTNDARMACFLTADKFGDMDLYNGTGTVLYQGTTYPNQPHMDLTYGYMNSDEANAIAKAYVKSRTPNGLEEAYQMGYYYLNAQLKFWVKGSPGVAPLCFIRSSEMVLIEAEASYFLNDEPAAQAALIELNATSGRNPDYTCTKTGADLFQEIVDYRELELWGEGFNWYDLKRWNRPIIRKSFAEGGNNHIATATTIAADEWTWAIPETETDHNNLIER